MTDMFRWGLIGPGKIAQAFADAVAGMPDAEIAAVASRDLERAAAFAEKNGVRKAVGSYEALAQDPDIDAVYIANTNPAHYATILLCLDHGKHVLCEKPLCLNETQAELVLRVAKEQGLFLMEGIWSRCLPIHRKVEAMIADGTIGEVRMLKADIGFSAPWPDDDRHVDPKNGGGALLDVGVYNLAFAVRHLGREPLEIKSIVSRFRTGVDERSTVLLQYPDGRSAVLTCAINVMMPHDASLYGTAGSIRMPFYWRGSEAEISRFGKPFTPPEISVEKAPFEKGAGYDNGYGYEIAEAMRCIRAGLTESPLMPWADSLAISRIMTALRKEWNIRYDGQPGEG